MKAKKPTGLEGTWYDGRFFDIFIAPNQDKIFSHVGKILDDNSSVLDIGCGTGRMAFKLADKCARIDGVDSSLKNIEVARRKLSERPNAGISFHHSDAVEFLLKNGTRYDFAVLSFVIHEIDEDSRLSLFSALRAAADRIIMVDYRVPGPGGIRSAFDEIVEFVAGAQNYRDYRSFMKGGGLAGLANRAGLEIIHELKGANLSAHLAVARWTS